MRRIENQPEKHTDIAKRAIVWLLNAKGTLTIHDLRFAVVFVQENPNFDHKRLPSEDFIVSICHGLVIVDRQTHVARLVREL